MGRPLVKDIVNQIKNMHCTNLQERNGKRPSSLLVYGTSGYGKSFMMADIAALLHRAHLNNAATCLPVIYLASCLYFDRDPFHTLHQAACVAFSRDRDVISKLKICADLDTVKRLLSNQPLILLVDQANQLMSTEAIQCLECISSRNILVQVFSATDQTRYEVTRKQGTENLLVPVFGQLSDQEWTEWVNRQKHEGRLPEQSSDQSVNSASLISHHAANTVLANYRNPSVVGFLIENWTIDVLSRSDSIKNLFDVSMSWQVESFDATSKMPITAPSSPSATLFIPNEFNAGSVDAFLRIVMTGQPVSPVVFHKLANHQPSLSNL